MAPDLNFSKVADTIKSIVIPDDSASKESGDNVQASYFKFLAASADEDSDSDTDIDDESMYSVSTAIDDKLDPEAEAENLRSKLRTMMAPGDEYDGSVQITDIVRERLGATGQEKLLGQIPAWQLTDVLCQGKSLLSANNIYFYAPLPYTGSRVIMEGTLRKRSSKGVGFTRYWYILRHDALAHYNSAADPYFPAGIIPLYNVKYVDHQPKENGEPSSSIYIIMNDDETVHLKADSPNSAHEWAKAIQKAIFVVRNKGEYAKVVIPFENVLTVSIVPVLDVAKSLRLVYIPGPGLKAQETVMLFFSRGEDAFNALVKYWKLKVGEDKIQTAGGPEKLALKNQSITVTKSVFNSTYFSGRCHKLPEHITEQLFRATKDDPSATTVISQKIVDTGTSVVSGTSSVVKGSLGLFSLHKVVGSHLKQAATEWIPEREKSISASQSERPSVSGSPVLSPQLTSDVDIDEAVRRAAAQRSGMEDTDFTGSAKAMLSRIFNASASIAYSVTDTKCNPEEDMHVITDDERADANERFQSQFSFSRRINLLSYYKCLLQRGKGQAMSGLIFLTNRYVCWRRAVVTSKTRMILPIDDVQSVEICEKSKFGNFGVQLHIRGSDPIYTELTTKDACESFVKGLTKLMEEEAEYSKNHTGDSSDSLDFVRYQLIQARLATYEDHLSDKVQMRIPPLVVDPYSRETNESFLVKPQEKLRITILTIGSRGDVQPYIALCQGLMAEGHICRICTHAEFRDFVEGYGIEFREVAGDPKALMQIMIDHGSFSLSFLKEAASKFRSWVAELLESAWVACQDSDVLIESPSAMAGVHIAEGLGIPYFRAFTMPWTRTHAYPHAFIVPDSNLGGSYNYMTYVMFENMMWRGTSHQINKWRKKTIGIRGTSLEGMRQQQIPFLYCVSPHVLVPPIDEPDWVHYTGYWQLEQDDTYEPPEELVAFMKKARDDKVPLVYIGFGSIVVDDVEKLTNDVIYGVEKAKVRAVVVKGWAERSSDGTKKEGAKTLASKSIFTVDAIPHQWLFPKVDAAVHHGGSGTTGMSLSCGIPTVIKPFFGDQFFYALRVTDLGCGLALKKITGDGLAKVLVEATSNKSIIERAKVIGEQISLENGVARAIQCIYRELPYAQSLVRPRKDVVYNPRRIAPTLSRTSATGDDEKKKKWYKGGSLFGR